jgi:hypothetical protein
MATDFSNTGAFNVNGQWATSVKYDATVDQGKIKEIALRFMNGRNELARATMSPMEARELLGEKNFERVAKTAKNVAPGAVDSPVVSGELKGKNLEFRQVTLTGYEGPQSENAIALDSRRRRPDESKDQDKLNARDVVVGSTEDLAQKVNDRISEAATGAPASQREGAESAARASAQPATVAPATELERQRRFDEEARLRMARSTGVPDNVAERFLRVDDKYYFPDKTLAFVDRGTKLKAETHNVEVVRSLVSIAQSRDWQALTVTGTKEFRREVWREATLRGIDVRGYDPSDLERQELQRASMKRNGPNEISREAPQRDRPVDAPKPAPSAGKQRSAGGGRDRRERDAIQTGVLLEAGAAPYEFDPNEKESYYVRLRTERGERVLWGVDLERALAESQTQVKAGDVVGIEARGARSVVVPVPIRDAQGNVVDEEERWVSRITWVVEKKEYFDARAVKAEAVRSETPRPELVKKHPDLTDAAVTLWVSEQFAKQIERKEDRYRVVALVRERLAEAVERGEQIQAPYLKRDVAIRLDAMAKNGELSAEVAPSARQSARETDRTQPPRGRVPGEQAYAR